MTTFNQFTDRNRDMQDGIERHVYGAQEYTDAGAIIRVRGTGTVDEEAVVLTQGYSFNLPQDYNTEVFLLASSSDTTLKYALMSLPRDKQRPWAEGVGGVQHPTDPERALEFNAKRTYVDDSKFATRGGVLEIDGDNVIIRGNLRVSGDLVVNGSIVAGGDISTAGTFRGPIVTTGVPAPGPVAGFDE